MNRSVPNLSGMDGTGEPPPPSKWYFPPTFLSGLLLVVAGTGLVLAGNGTRVLRIRSAPVRSKPSFEKGSREGTIYFGQSCEITKRAPDWVHIEWAPHRPGRKENERAETRTGWIHETALFKPSKSAPKPMPEWMVSGAKDLKSVPLSKQLNTFADARHLDLKAVLKLEAGYPSAKETDAFLRKGRLGLYREDWPSLAEGVAP